MNVFIGPYIHRCCIGVGRVNIESWPFRLAHACRDRYLAYQRPHLQRNMKANDFGWTNPECHESQSVGHGVTRAD